MRTLCKKALALCVVFALALTCFVGTLSVSAADVSFNAIVSVNASPVTLGDTTAEAVIHITLAESGICEALIKVSSPIGSVAKEVELVKDINGTPFDDEIVDETTGMTEFGALDYKVDYSGESSDFGAFFLSTKEYEKDDITEAFIKVTFTIGSDIEAGTYAVNIDTPEGKVIAASKSEDIINLIYDSEANPFIVTCEHEYGETVEVTAPTCTAAGAGTQTCSICKDVKDVEIPATGKHAYEYEIGDGKTHNFTCTVGGETGSEPCAPGEDGVTCVCGYVFVTECEHVNKTSVVTTRPTKDTEGVRTFTCSDCSESWTEAIPVATLRTTADDADKFKVANNLSLNSSIEIGFRLRASFINEATDYYAIFTKNLYDVDGNVTGTSVTYKYAEDFVGVSTNGVSINRYDVNCDDVTAPEMTANVNAEIYRELADGSFEYVVRDYSVASYANDTLGVYGSSFDTLVVDMLNYGTAAQEYSDYNLANKANAAFDKFADYLDCASTTTAAYTNNSSKATNAGDNYAINLSRQLDLKSSITILAQVRGLDKKAYAGDMTNIRAKCTYNNYSGDEVTDWIDYTDFDYDEDTKMYSVAFDKFTTVEIDSKVVIEIYDGDTLISDTISYSIGSYLEELKSINYDTTSELYVLVENMTKYCTSAINYF